ncbi:MAG: signal peptidase I [Armatimonadetes bacterium]|nr:signal peptidase I [Armatimonadota bacterium]
MARKFKRRSAATYGWTSAVTLLVLLGVTLWVSRSLRLADIPSKSMVPTLLPGDIVTNRIDAYRSRMPRRGEIVLFRDKEDGGLLIKRVIGEPGETLTVWSGRVWIGGRRLAESYATGELILERPITTKLGDDEVWVMGDNRDFSDDSRDFGPVNKSQLVGRATAIIWPAARRQPLDPPTDATPPDK